VVELISHAYERRGGVQRLFFIACDWLPACNSRKPSTLVNGVVLAAPSRPSPTSIIGCTYTPDRISSTVYKKLKNYLPFLGSGGTEAVWGVKATMWWWEDSKINGDEALLITVPTTGPEIPPTFAMSRPSSMAIQRGSISYSSIQISLN